MSGASSEPSFAIKGNGARGRTPGWGQSPGTKPLGRGEPYLEWGVDWTTLQKATSAQSSPGSHAWEPPAEMGQAPRRERHSALPPPPNAGSLGDKKPKLPEDML